MQGGIESCIKANLDEMGIGFRDTDENTIQQLTNEVNWIRKHNKNGLGTVLKHAIRDETNVWTVGNCVSNPYLVSTSTPAAPNL